MNFAASSVLPVSIDENSLWFIFHNDDMLVLNNEERIEPLLKSDLDKINLSLPAPHYLGSLEGRQCFAAELKSETNLPADISFRSMRSLLVVFDEILFTLAGKAFQVIEWDRNHKYCGRCGTKTEFKKDERAKICPNCGLVNYPRISPAVIVAVIKENKILLARATRFKTKMYSVLAGFVEPGETFEECVQREILEEVNIKVKDIKYFGSQPWPFPDSIMIGFTAQYESGEIKADHEEIMDAGWYSPEDLPEVPLPGRWSIARKLIDWYLGKYEN